MLTAQQIAAIKITIDVMSKTDSVASDEVCYFLTLFLVDQNAIKGSEDFDNTTTKDEAYAYANYVLSRPIGAAGLVPYTEWIKMRRQING